MTLTSLKMPLIIVAGILIALWIGWGLFQTYSVAEPDYTVIEQREGYEIREYAPYIVAETLRDDNFDEALNSGFMVVAGYIFGDNTSKQKIDMTTPVISKGSEKIPMTAPVISEKIAMTAPVLQENEEKGQRIAFVMPKEYTMETLPEPNDDRVTLREIPKRKVAVLRFSWFFHDKKVKKMEQQLTDMLKRDKLEYSSISFAGYNGPWTPPFMRRNEIWAELK